jgi:GAF domain-containing protein/ActR/RegA family two-component response regulator
MDEVQPYNDREIALAETFAAQAAIAVENARLFNALEERNREQGEALEREQATAEVLRVISRSPEDLGASLKAVAEAAARLCKGEDALVWLRDGDYLVSGARARDVEPSRFSPGNRLGPISDRNTPAVISARTATTIHVVDVKRWAEEHTSSPEELQQLLDRVGWEGTNSRLVTPLLRGGEVVGVLLIFRRGEPAPFSDREIALAETFADQAAIAVENARLIQGIQDRNRELTEALEQQTATADVLRIISRAPVEPEAVLAEISERAARLCDAPDAGVLLLEGGTWHARSLLNIAPPPSGFEHALSRGYIPDRAVLDRETVHIVGELTELKSTFPGSAPILRWHGFERVAYLAVPLLRKREPIGVLVLRRREARPFTDKQITLAETFADQAVIAIENARLFDELQERNREQAEALEREQATAEVLRVISRSPEDLEASLKAVAEAAARLCKGEDAVVWLRDGDYLVGGGRAREVLGVFRPGNRVGPISDVTSPATIAARTGTTLHIVDMRRWVEEHASSPEELQLMLDRVLVEGTNSRVAAPLLRGGDVVGVLVIFRRGGPAPFSEREITLAETFADQAAIAVENARLFQGIQDRNRELTVALEREQATAEVLRVISRSPEDLDASLQAVADTAAQLCQADYARVMLREGDELQVGPTASFGVVPDVKLGARLTNHHGPSGEVVRTGRTVDFSDLLQYFKEHGGTKSDLKWIGDSYASVGPRGGLATPLLRGSDVIGVLLLGRYGSNVSFADREIALAETFADQAAIAVENARLFLGIQERNRELSEALEQQAATADVLRLISQSTLDLPRVLNALAGCAARLCDADVSFIGRVRDGVGRPEAFYGLPEGALERQMSPRRRPVAERAEQEGRSIQVVDFYAEFGAPRDGVHRYPARLAVPLLRDGLVIGSFTLWRSEAQAFTERQIELVESFADQAVIAMENARLFEELQARTQELEAVSGAKSDFLSRMSHELRTPLNAIMVSAETMAMDPDTSGRQRVRVHRILQSGRHQQGLIDEVIDIVRIEAGRLSLSVEPVQVEVVVQEVLDLERPLAEAAGVELVIEELGAFDVAVQADRQRLRQILINLVGNAVKYNRRGGKVTLAVQRDLILRQAQDERSEEAAREDAGGAPTEQDERSGRIRLTVRDTGPGIEAEQIDRVFEPFERGAAEGGDVEGTGLGLAIARGLAEAMSGSIGVESVVGEGSAFWIDLPVAAEPREQVSADISGAEGLEPAETKLTVLYVEDNQSNIAVLRDALDLARPGVTLLAAQDGAAGVRMARQYKPGLVLLDLNMPGLPGDEVLVKLRQHKRTAGIPVVMVSADATPGQFDRLLAAGARDYLTKPLQVQRLLEIIDEIAAGEAR